MTDVQTSEIEQLPKLFREIRKAHGINQADVAANTKSQYRQKTVSQFENCEKVAPETATQLIEALLELVRDRISDDRAEELGAMVDTSTDSVISLDGEHDRDKAEAKLLDFNAVSAEKLSRYIATTSPMDVRCFIEPGHDWIGVDAATLPLLTKLDQTIEELSVARNNRRHKNPTSFTQIAENEIQVATIANKMSSALLDLKARIRWTLLTRHNGTHDTATVLFAIIKNTQEPKTVSYRQSLQKNLVNKVEKDRLNMVNFEGSER